MWMGAAKGHVDPVKEVKAAEMRVALGMTTGQQEAMAYNGNDWDANVRQRRKEAAALSAQEGGTKLAEPKNNPKEDKKT